MKPSIKLLSIGVRVVVCAVLLMIALSMFQYLKSTAPVPAASEDAAAPRAVPVIRLQPVTVGRQWHGFGTARPLNSADVPSRVNAVVTNVPVLIEEGAHLRSGDVLVELDATDFQRSRTIAANRLNEIDQQLAQVDVDEASWTTRVELASEALRLAEEDYQRTLDAFNRNAAKQFEVDRERQAVIAATREQVAAQTELNKLNPRRAVLNASRTVQEEQQRVADDNIARCRITCPIDGVVAMLDVEEGEHLNNGHRVARIVNTDVVEIPFRLPASARSTIAVGDRVHVMSTGDNRTDWNATIARLSAEDDPKTRTMTIFVVIEKSTDVTPPPPGRYLHGVVYPSLTERRSVVPRLAVSKGRVRLVEDGRIRHTPIEIAFNIEQEFPQFSIPSTQWVVLETEIETGALLVLDATRELPEGVTIAPVIVNEPDDRPEDRP